MQETHNNCFGSKKRSTILLQAKTGKHECRSYKTSIKPNINEELNNNKRALSTVKKKDEITIFEKMIKE